MADFGQISQGIDRLRGGIAARRTAGLEQAKAFEDIKTSRQNQNLAEREFLLKSRESDERVKTFEAQRAESLAGEEVKREQLRRERFDQDRKEKEYQLVDSMFFKPVTYGERQMGYDSRTKMISSASGIDENKTRSAWQPIYDTLENINAKKVDPATGSPVDMSALELKEATKVALQNNSTALLNFYNKQLTSTVNDEQRARIAETMTRIKDGSVVDLLYPGVTTAEALTTRKLRQELRAKAEAEAISKKLGVSKKGTKVVGDMIYDEDSGEFIKPPSFDNKSRQEKKKMVTDAYKLLVPTGATLEERQDIFSELANQLKMIDQGLEPTLQIPKFVEPSVVEDPLGIR